MGFSHPRVCRGWDLPAPRRSSSFTAFRALDIPGDARPGAGTLFPSQAAARRQEGLFDLAAMGRAAELRCVWKVPVLAVALIRQAVALKVERGGPGGPWVFG